MPFSAKRAAHPPPITPPPSSATARGRSAMADEAELLAHVGGPEHAHVHGLEDRAGPLDELAVGGEGAPREVEVVLEPDAHVAAGEGGHRDVRQLHPADRER